jgi:hypothetical protein
MHPMCPTKVFMSSQTVVRTSVSPWPAAAQRSKKMKLDAHSSGAADAYVASGVAAAQ